MNAEQRRARRAERRHELKHRRRQAVALACLLLGLVLALAVITVPLSNSGGGVSGHAGKTIGAAHDATGGKGSGAPAPASLERPRGNTPTEGQGTEPVPILMYHVIAAPPPRAPFPGLYVPASEFAAQMHALARAGFHAVTLDQVQAYWRNGTPLPAGRPIVLSFDNGYQSQYTQAFPVLRALGWVGDENLQLTGLPPSQGGLSQAQVRGLIGAGWELDTQGFSHADLVALSPAELHYQVAVARAVIRQRYRVAANWFCYPSGQYDASVIAAVKAAGFIGSTTVVPGWAGPSQDPYRLPRLRILGGTSPQALLALIAATRSNGPPPTEYKTDS